MVCAFLWYVTVLLFKQMKQHMHFLYLYLGSPTMNCYLVEGFKQQLCPQDQFPSGRVSQEWLKRTPMKKKIKGQCILSSEGGSEGTEQQIKDVGLGLVWSTVAPTGKQGISLHHKEYGGLQGPGIPLKVTLGRCVRHVQLGGEPGTELEDTTEMGSTTGFGTLHIPSWTSQWKLLRRGRSGHLCWNHCWPKPT